MLLHHYFVISRLSTKARKQTHGTLRGTSPRLTNSHLQATFNLFSMGSFDFALLIYFRSVMHGEVPCLTKPQMCCVITCTLTKPEICSGSNSKFAIWKESSAFVGSDEEFKKPQVVYCLEKERKKNRGRKSVKCKRSVSVLIS